MISSKFAANLIRVTGGFTLGFALVAPCIAGPPPPPASTSFDPEPADFEGANPGHQVEFRKVNGDINNLADAIALLNFPPGHPNFSWQAHDDGVAVINYSDWGTSAPSQGNFGNDRDIRVIPGSYFSEENTDGYVMRASGFIYIPTPGNWMFTVKIVTMAAN